MKWLYPRISLRNFRFALGLGAVGALIAGIYGIVHDQVTYALAPEYFTKFKFNQFAYANLGFGDGFFAGTIGFLATWWVGFIAGWLLGRVSIRSDGSHPPLSRMVRLFLIVVTTAVVFGIGGSIYGTLRWEAAESGWQWWRIHYGVEDLPAFARVGHIHNAGYLGAFTGLVVAIVLVRRESRT